MTTRTLWFTVTALASILLAIGLWGAWSRMLPVAPRMQLYAQDMDESPGIAVEIATTSTSISYQGRLTSTEGEALDGTHFMRFRVYDAASDGTELWDSDSQEVPVSEGLFTVMLDIEPTLFDGRDLWLQLNVNGQALSPRRPLLAAPYALGLMPGVMVQGAPHESSGQTLGATLADGFPDGKALSGYAPATGTALYAGAAGGQGLAAFSEQNYGVRGASAESWGGYFSSEDGYSLVAETGGTDHWDHAGVFQAQSGYALFAESAGNMGIRSHAGDITGAWQPVGSVGVVGIGASRGLYGSAISSYGVYGTSLNWYGIYGRTSRSDNNYGLFTPDNLHAASLTTTGASMMIVQNGSGEMLQPGDVVAASGIGELQTAGSEPLLSVAKADIGNSHALAGVVYSWYNPAVLVEDFDPATEIELTRTGPIQPGDTMLIVTHGIAPVNVSAAQIEPGDALAVGLTGGIAARMDEVSASLSGSETELAVAANSVPIRAIGTALESATGEQTRIRVFVSLR